MSAPRQVNDGNWNEKQYFSIEPSFPFTSVGDDKTFVMRCRWRQDKAAYKRPILMTQVSFAGYGTAYLVDNSDARDIGNGLYEGEDTFASLPSTRNEPGSYPYTAQVYKTIPPWEIQEYTTTRPGFMRYEYFLKPPDPIYRRRVFITFLTLNVVNGTDPDPQPGVYVAEDSTTEIYMGQIYVRKTQYVTTPVTNNTNDS